MEVLLVVCEPSFSFELKGTRNRSLNEILKSYKYFFGEVHCLCPSDQFRLSTVENDGIFYHTIPAEVNNSFNKLFYPIHIKRFYLDQIILHIKPNVIQYRVPSLFSIIIYYRLRHVKSMLTVYIAGDIEESININYKFYPGIRLISKALYWMQKSLITNSRAVSAGHELAKKYRKINDNIHPYYSTTHLDVKLKSAINTDVVDLIFIGRLEPLKRIEDLIWACNILRNQNVPFRLYIVGEGKSSVRLKNLVRDLDLITIQFLEKISDKTVLNNLLDSCDLLVLPSITEGTPKVLPEAMARGVVPIAVDGVGSINHIIKNKINGFTVPARNPEAIARTILDFINLNEKRQDILNACFDYATKHTLTNEVAGLWKFILNEKNEKNIKKWP